MSFTTESVLESQRYTVTRGDLVRYAGASGDFNPIHWSDRIATAVGLPGVIAHGKFTNMVVVPDTDEGAVVEIAGRITSADDGLVAIALEVTCDGQKALGNPKAVVRV